MDLRAALSRLCRVERIIAERQQPAAAGPPQPAWRRPLWIGVDREGPARVEWSEGGGLEVFVPINPTVAPLRDQLDPDDFARLAARLGCDPDAQGPDRPRRIILDPDDYRKTMAFLGREAVPHGPYHQPRPGDW